VSCAIAQGFDAQWRSFLHSCLGGAPLALDHRWLYVRGEAMKNRRQHLGSALLIVLCAGVITTAQQTQPDNTRVNTRDQTAGAVTADQQSNGAADLKTTQAIRRAIVADKSLSTYAHNVKVITVNGKVTLKGPVRSDAEKMAVEQKATEVAGAANVTDNLSIMKPRAKKRT
jgi:hyperosmotically inducible periplasmic protein